MPVYQTNLWGCECYGQELLCCPACFERPDILKRAEEKVERLRLASAVLNQ